MRKASFYSELAYVVGIVGLALGTAFMEKADLACLWLLLRHICFI